MSNDTFQELYDKLIDDNNKLRNTGIDDLSVWSVDYNGYGRTVAIETAQALESITSTGNVIITERHGAFLKIRSNCWVRTAIGDSKAVLHSIGIVSILLSEDLYVATLINTSE